MHSIRSGLSLVHSRYETSLGWRAKEKWQQDYYVEIDDRELFCMSGGTGEPWLSGRASGWHQHNVTKRRRRKQVFITLWRKKSKENDIHGIEIRQERSLAKYLKNATNRYYKYYISLRLLEVARLDKADEAPD